MGSTVPIRALVVGHEAQGMCELESTLNRSRGLESAGAVAPIQALSGLRPLCDVVLVATDGEPQSLGLVRELVSGSDVPVLVVAESVGERLLHAAMAAGARGVIARPIDPEALVSTVRAAAWPGIARVQRRSDGRVLAVCGCKGGVGATTLAVMLASIAGGLLIDAAPGHADLAGHLGCEPERGLADLARLGQAVGPEAIATVITLHPSGLRMIAGAGGPDGVSLLPVGLAPAMVRECRSAAAWTLLDIGVPLAPMAVEAVACVDVVLISTTPDGYAVAAAGALAQRLAALGVTGDAVRLVVNRWRRGGEFSLRSIERSVGLELAGAVRDDRRLARRFADEGAVPGRRGGGAADMLRMARRLGAG